MRYGSIYLLTNRQTGEQYVGQTIKSVKHRWASHCAAAKRPKFAVAYSIAKYGHEAFGVEELYVAFDREALNNAEKAIIADIRPSLNLTRGGAGKPVPMSEEEKQKFARRSKALWTNPEWRLQMIAKLKAAERKEIPYEVLRQRGVRVSSQRWAGHVKKITVANGTQERAAQRSAITTQTWQDPETRARRLEAMRQANLRPEVKAKRSLSSTGRVMPAEAIEKAARAKWKPVYCPELQVSFLSQKHAAQFFGVLNTAICEAIKRKGKVQRMFTLTVVA